MIYPACFSMLHRASGTKMFRVVAVGLILAVPFAVAARRAWNSEYLTYAMTGSDRQSSARPGKPVSFSTVQEFELRKSISVGSVARVYGSDPVSEMLRQEDEEILSAVFVGQMFAPPCVAMAQRQMIDRAVNRHSDSLLHVACQSGNQLAVWLLIEAGASTTVRNCFDETPLDVAMSTDAQNETYITTMIKQHVIPTPLMAHPAAHQG